MGKLLEVQHLKKYFKTPRGMLHAVDDVSFSIDQGKTIGVVGESGCGKSTLGRTLIHLLESTDGKIFFHGEDITHADKKEAPSAPGEHADYLPRSFLLPQSPHDSL